MKLLFSIIVLFVATLGVTSESSEEYEKFMAEQAEICQEKIGASDQDREAMLNGDEPTTRMAKCLNECLMTKLEVMKDGKLVADQFVEMYKDDVSVKSKDGKPLKDYIKDIADACKNVTAKDECEAAALILACLNSEAQKRGFKNNVF